MTMYRKKEKEDRHIKREIRYKKDFHQRSLKSSSLYIHHNRRDIKQQREKKTNIIF
jgi:hypothetical protein